ncbi:MAG: serine protease [Bacilli bacterium]|nr:serine protease [Bacilli bacterium]
MEKKTIDKLEEEKQQLEIRIREIKEEEKKKIEEEKKKKEIAEQEKEKKDSNNHQISSNISNNPNNVNIGVVIILVIIISAISGCLGSYVILKSKTTTTTNEAGITTSSIKLDETNTISESVDKVYDAVVVVEGYSKKQLASTGTGFVYKKLDGKAYIITNHHVVANCDSVKLLFTNGDELETKILGSDAYSDIAVLSVKDSNKIKAATMGDSEKSKVGDTVFTVGSPEGADYAGTVTKGILSGKDRLVAVALTNSTTSDYYMNVLQTDAAINPGNSGGPICNINGEVIGITNMKLVDDSVEGMGFAIPIKDALNYAATLEKSGKISRPYIGISMLDLTNSFYLWQAGINIPENVKAGVAIYTVEDNSPASKAGLKKGDIITKIGDHKVESLAEFRYQLYKSSPNDKIKITYYRDGKEQTTTVTLGENRNN